jgi:hypothetical protein
LCFCSFAIVCMCDVFILGELGEDLVRA